MLASSKTQTTYCGLCNYKPTSPRCGVDHESCSPSGLCQSYILRLRFPIATHGGYIIFMHALRLRAHTPAGVLLLLFCFWEGRCTHRDAWMAHTTHLHVESISQNSSCISSETAHTINSCVRTAIRVGLCSSLALTTGHTAPPTATPSAYSHCLRAHCQPIPPTCPAPLTASPCERTPAPCPQCSVSRGDGHLLSHHHLHLNSTEVW